MPNPQAPFYPIIYVRGFAMSQGEQDETTADPFCGFNLGSTVYRATPDQDKPAKKFVFESPVLRLTTDFGYADVYKDGLDILDPEWEAPLPPRCIVIHRYYDQASALLGTGKTPAITDFAKGLSDLILRVRELVCLDTRSGITANDFRCYLVAHSMGGLICRAFLQNPALGDDTARKCVDKVFTYATPHNGIDMAGMNVPQWLSAGEMNNFNRDYMAEYLNLKDRYTATKRVDWLPEAVFPSEKFFCMVGTNRADYQVAMGLSRTFSGHGSDGLVKIENASVWGMDASGQISKPCATAYAYRSHSGFFGIVNSEESYQNLTRFLFGDIRVDVWADVAQVALPEAIKNDPVDALYQFELLASPRGKRWYLSRRQAEEDSVACISQKELGGASATNPVPVYLSSVFLANRARVNQDNPSLAYGLTFGVRVPDYEIDHKFWPNGHFEGGYLFRDTLIVEMVPPSADGGEWNISFAWQSNQLGRTKQPLAYKALGGGKIAMTVAFQSPGAPGVSGQLRFVVSAWNA